MPDWESAVVDRIVDGNFAVLLVGDQEQERIVPRTALPREIRDGAWLKTRWEGDRLLEAEVDPEGTQQAAARIAAKLALLRKRGRPSS